MKDTTLRLIVILEYLASQSSARRPAPTRDIVHHLHQHGIDACERTVQRAINQLECVYWLSYRPLPNQPGHGWLLQSRLDPRFLRTLRYFISAA